MNFAQQCNAQELPALYSVDVHTADAVATMEVDGADLASSLVTGPDRILFVDDHPASVELLRRTFRSSRNIFSYCVRDERRFNAFLASGRTVHCVASDLSIPNAGEQGRNLRGLNVVSASRDRNLPTVLVSGVWDFDQLDFQPNVRFFEKRDLAEPGHRDQMIDEVAHLCLDTQTHVSRRLKELPSNELNQTDSEVSLRALEILHMATPGAHSTLDRLTSKLHTDNLAMMIFDGPADEPGKWLPAWIGREPGANHATTPFRVSVLGHPELLAFAETAMEAANSILRGILRFKAPPKADLEYESTLLIDDLLILRKALEDAGVTTVSSVKLVKGST